MEEKNVSESDEFDQHFKIWSKAIDVQMHFNDIQTKTRQFSFAFVTAVFGLGALFLAREDNSSFNLCVFQFEWKMHVVSILALIAAFVFWAVQKLDLGVYQKLLRGAVAFNMNFEERHIKRKFALKKGLSETITYYSKNDAKFPGEEGGFDYPAGPPIDTEKTAKCFYWYTIIALIIVAVAIFIVNNLNVISCRT